MTKFRQQLDGIRHQLEKNSKINQQLENKMRIRHQFDGIRHQLENNSTTIRKYINNWKTKQEFDINSTKF